jgi:hypothetical protein
LLEALLVYFAIEVLCKGVTVKFLVLKVSNAPGEMDDAGVAIVLLISAVLCLAPVAREQGEARLVLVVRKLVSRHGDLLAAVADNWLVRTTLSMIRGVFDVQVSTTSVAAVEKDFITLGLDVSFKLFKRDVDSLASVVASEGRIFQDLLGQKVDITWFAQGSLTRVASVSIRRLVRGSTGLASEASTLCALAWVVSQFGTPSTR